VNDNLLPERSRIVEEHLATAGITAPIHELPASTRTAAEAAEALGCEVGAIASSLLFVADDEPVLVMTSGRRSGASLPPATPNRSEPSSTRRCCNTRRSGLPREPPHTVMALTFTDLITLTNGTRVVVASD
jgi:hypothetical protein